MVVVVQHTKNAVLVGLFNDNSLFHGVDPAWVPLVLL